MKKLPLSALLLAAVAPLSHATLLVSETFSGYGSGPAVGSSTYLPDQTTLGTGLSGTWASGDSYAWVSNAGDLAAPLNSGSLADSSGTKLVFSGGSTPSAYATIASPLSTVSTTYYVSFVAQFSNGSSANFSGLWLGNGGTYILRLGTGDGARWGISDGTTVLSATGTTSSTAAFLVYAITFGAAGGANDSVSLYVNPGVSGQPAIATATWSGLSLNDASANRLMLRGNTNNPNNQIDNIRIGTTYADVAAVPEPSAYGLAGAGLLAAGAVFRRRKRA